MSGFFYNLGRHLGHKAVPAIRKSKLIWDGLAGNEEEAFRAEVALGTDMAAELRTSVELIGDPPTLRLVGELCQRLSACVRDKRRTFRCELFHDRFPNAMALPGGFLFVSNSLIELCEGRSDELAFVLGHEMAHVIRGHAWDRMLNEAVLRAASAATSRVGQLGGWLRQQGISLLRSAHSRDQEFEADELGLRLCVAARFPASGALHLLQRLQQLHRDPLSVGQYFASHPPAPERMARVAQTAAQVSS